MKSAIQCVLVIAGIAALGCASRPSALEPRVWTEARTALADGLEVALAESPPAANGEVVVRLAFGAAADLDLYVTDPLQETLYFANTPTVSGGRLEADLRCESEDGETRIETVRFPSATPGRYRVGIDFPASCVRGRDDTPYALAVDIGGARQISRGLARFVVFDVIVAEFDVRDGGAGSP